jgi:hypothetical protein
MLYVIQKLDDPMTHLVADDPVRPEIPLDFRISDSSEIFVWTDEATGRPGAVVCVAYRCSVPSNVFELVERPVDVPSSAIFYTIWSYTPGSGRKLIRAAQQWIKTNRPEITEFVTLSPPTEMAKVFHIRNGAGIFRVNSDTVNYQYP